MTTVRPPRVARWLLSRLLPVPAREFVIGDLDEEFARHQTARGRRLARRWYWSQAVRSIGQTSRHEPEVLTMPHRPRTILSTLASDARFAVRTLRRSPGHALTALLTLAVGTGALIAIFSAVNAVLLRPLPYGEPGRLVMMWESNQARGWHRVEAAPANVEDWRERVTSLADIAFLSPFTQALSLVTDAGPVRVQVAQVSGNFFDVLGVPPQLGRTLTDAETFEPGLVVLGHAVWRRHFQADVSLVGRSIRLDGRPHQVVGIMPPDFVHPVGDAEIWTTAAPMATRRASLWWRQAHVIRPLARLASGATAEEAAAELARVASQLAIEFPATNTGMEAGLAPMQEFLTGDRRLTLLLLLGAVGILQLIACANVAHLLLGRAVERRQELAVRAALGAGRGRLLRQLLTESLVLATAGTALGLVLGVAGLAALSSLAPPALGSIALAVDWRLVAFTVAVGAGSALLFGAWPAWRTARSGAGDLSDGTRSGTAGRERRLASDGIVAAEVMLAVLLVAAAGLMVRTLGELNRLPTGIDPADVLTFQVHPSRGTFPQGADRVRFAATLVDRIEAMPGVVSAGVGRGLPLTGYGWTSDFTIEGWEPGQFGVEVRHREALPGYFETLRVPVLSGRLFDDGDLAPEAPVPVVVNQAFVDRYFPDQSPVGRRVAFDRAPTERSYWYPIVGVVANERRDLLTEPVPEIIGHLRGDVPATLSFVVRTSVPPLSIVPQVRATLGDLDAEAPLLSVRTMAQVAADARVSQRFLMTLLLVFAGAALVLAAVGVSGVALQAARARTREVGIRLALGAPVAAVVRRLAARGVVTVAIGVGAGLAAAAAGGRLLESYLFQVSPRDPLTLTAVVGLIAGVGIVAHVWPTWRTARVDPAIVLRPPV
ncbi:MAG TPA: ADOP family duplicated permease [Vicinamibacterales bacterium]|nr:ADOP family duplicated permease [Vicinamibacterales bacterium]